MGVQHTKSTADKTSGANSWSLEIFIKKDRCKLRLIGALLECRLTRMCSNSKPRLVVHAPILHKRIALCHKPPRISKIQSPLFCFFSESECHVLQLILQSPLVSNALIIQSNSISLRAFLSLNSKSAAQCARRKPSTTTTYFVRIGTTTCVKKIGANTECQRQLFGIAIKPYNINLN